jgi:hypothetical protein
VLAHPGDAWLARFYAPDWHVTPNLGFDPFAMLLLRLVPVHVGGRLILAAALLLPPLSVLAYSRAAFGRVTVWALAASLLAFNGIFFLGFLNFLLAASLAFVAAGLWLLLRRQGRDGLCAVTGAIAVALIFLCHIFGVILFAVLVAAQEFSRRSEGKFLRGTLLLAISLAPAMALYAASPLAGDAAAVMGFDAKHKVWDLFIPFMTYAKPLTLLTGLLVFGAVIFLWRGAVIAPGTVPALVLLALVYLVSPVSLKGGTFVDVRFALMMAMLVFGGIAPALTQRQEKALLLVVLLLTGLRSAAVAQVWLGHRGDLADVRAAIAQVPPGARVMAARDENPVTDPAQPGRALPDTQRLDSHLPALLVIERDAFWPFLFADPAQQPMVVRAPYDRLAQPLFDPMEWRDLQKPLPPRLVAAEPYLRHWPADFDYLLLVDRPPRLTPPAGLTPVYIGPYAVLYRVEP